jgi:hypothetical protein
LSFQGLVSAKDGPAAKLCEGVWGPGGAGTTGLATASSRDVTNVALHSRAAEFTASGPVPELVARIEVAKRQLRDDLAAADPDAPLRAEPPQAYLATKPNLSQGGALVHVYEELAQHHGQLEIIRDLVRRAQ